MQKTANHSVMASCLLVSLMCKWVEIRLGRNSSSPLMFQTSRHEIFPHTAFAQQEAVWTSIPQPSDTFTNCEQGELNYSSNVAVSPFLIKAPSLSYIPPCQLRPTHHSVPTPQGLRWPAQTKHETKRDDIPTLLVSCFVWELAIMSIFQLAQFSTPLKGLLLVCNGLLVISSLGVCE